MATRCSICNDERVRDVDAALAAGRSARQVAAEFGLGYRSIARHGAQHVATRTVAAAEPSDDRITELLEAVRETALRANNAGMVQQYRMLLAMLEERGKAQAVYDVRKDPDWLRIRDAIHDALRDEPTARQKVIDALRGLA